MFTQYFDEINKFLSIKPWALWNGHSNWFKSSAMAYGNEYFACVARTKPNWYRCEGSAC